MSEKTNIVLRQPEKVWHFLKIGTISYISAEVYVGSQKHCIHRVLGPMSPFRPHCTHKLKSWTSRLD